MKKTLLATALACVCATASAADNYRVGVLLGYTGPIESLTPDMAGSAEMAIKEASDSGALLGGATLEPVRGDSTCVDAAAGTATA
ncbi:MAG: branched-chain amino acid ABC transporter substrate-binding protein, partial [Granulosicoccaceae bacterium]